MRAASEHEAVSHVGHQLIHEPDWAAQPGPVIERAEGSLLWDTAGRRIIDGNSGLQNVFIGHGRRELAEVAARQIEQLDYFPLYNGSHPLVESLAARLHSLLPGLERFYFGNSGSEAVETALKLVREYWLLKGEPQRTVLLARDGSYHGASLGALALTGVGSRREPFRPLLSEVARLSRPGAEPAEGEVAAAARLAAELRDTIERVGPQRVMAIVGEPLQVIGHVLPPAGYWPAFREISREYGIPLVADEIITGFGRTGTWFGLDHWKVEADVVTLAKGLSSGYAPISAVGISGEIARAFDESPGAMFHHLSTTAGHPVSCALALANLDIIEREGLVEQAADSGRLLLSLLKKAFADHPCVADVRGIGLLCTVEFDPSNAPVGAAADARLARACLEQGAYLRAGGDLLFAPPISTEPSLLHELVAIAARAVEAWLAHERSDAGP
jgi:adenosylmethionine-8-amino-7-oxononanoate aminotransferase